MSFPIETSRLLIRPFTRDAQDVEALHAMLSDPEVMRYIGRPPSASVEETRERLEIFIELHERLGYSSWAVIEKSNGEIIGHCGVFPMELKGPDIELGYKIRRDCWNRGYATESVRACLDYSFRELKFDRIVAVVFPENMASRRVLEKCGMLENGVYVHHGIEGTFYEINRSRWPMNLSLSK
ncbi:MAG: GNAT family N-acetyltransferase [bacterium]